MSNKRCLRDFRILGTKLQFCVEIRKEYNYPVFKVVQIWEKLQVLEKTGIVYPEDTDIFDFLRFSKNISCVYDDGYSKYEDTRTRLDEFNMLQNKAGLTISERWFNTLSNEEKDHVIDLAHTTFLIAASAG